MRYIRTKDGQILDMSKCLDSNTTQFGLLRFQKSYLNHKQTTICVKNIIKEADTIKELCNKFVYHNIETGTFTVLDTLLPLQKHSKINVDYEQFGAIWTDTGLIYVAKMNEKGELELL